MTSRGKFWGPLEGPGKIFGGQWPPWHPPSSGPVTHRFPSFKRAGGNTLVISPLSGAEPSTESFQ